MRFGKLDLDPAKSPAVLDTATWDREGLARTATSLGAGWMGLFDRPQGGGLARAHGIDAAGACLRSEGRSYLPIRLDDGQHAFVAREDARGRGPGVDPLGEALVRLVVGGGRLSVYPADARVIDLYCRALRPDNAPRALGRIPRLGIGTRMTTRIWPGVFKAMAEAGFAANAIQNSVRELNLLDDMREGKPPERNTAFCFGEIESGYTGSTFEGLWVAGTMAALTSGERLTLGADADHIQLKRNDHGFRRALAVVEAARYYSFFTLDPSDILDYGALGGSASGDAVLDAKVPDPGLRKELLAWHGTGYRHGGRTLHLEPDLIGRLVGKYWDAFEGAEILVDRIKTLKQGAAFDLEFAYDENPPAVSVADSVSLDEENLFIMQEARRRGLPISHIAPNLGVEKGRDYRLPDGLEALSERLSSAVSMAGEKGFMVDVHSADDLGAKTRLAIGAAGRGMIHYKISPSLMYLFAQCVHESYPGIFRLWWDDALDYARREAGAGSPIARECLAELEDSSEPSPGKELFHQFYFAFPGRRDAAGRYVNREMLYSLSSDFYASYQAKVARRLSEIASEVLAS